MSFYLLTAIINITLQFLQGTFPNTLELIMVFLIFLIGFNYVDYPTGSVHHKFVMWLTAYILTTWLLLHPRFLVDRCDQRIGNRTLRFCIVQGFDDEMYGVMINAIIQEYRFCMILEYADRLLALLMGFCSEMLATRLLVQIDMFKRKIIN